MTRTQHLTDDPIRHASFEEPNTSQMDYLNLINRIVEVVSIAFNAEESEGLHFLIIVWLGSLGFKPAEIGLVIGRSQSWVYRKRKLLRARIEELKDHPERIQEQIEEVHDRLEPAVDWDVDWDDEEQVDRYHKEYYEKNRKRILEDKKSYYQRNREAILEKRRIRCRRMRGYED